MESLAEKTFTWKELTQVFGHTFTEEEARTVYSTLADKMDYDNALALVEKILDATGKEEQSTWTMLEKLAWVARCAYIAGATEATETAIKVNVMGFIELAEQEATDTLVNAIADGSIDL